MTNQEAYEYQLNRLTPEQKIQVNVKEGNIQRQLSPWEITVIFKLDPTGDIKPRKRRASDEVEDNRWMDQ